MSQEEAAERAGLNGSGQAWSRLERENGYSQALSVLAIAAKGVGLTLQQLIEEAQKVDES